MKLTFNQLKRIICESYDVGEYEEILCELFEVDDISEITKNMYEKILQEYENNTLNEHDSSLLEEAAEIVYQAANENGYNIIAHHGTTVEFSEFKKGDIGFHLGTLEQAKMAAKAHTFFHSEEGIIYLNTAISLHNPLVINNDPECWDPGDLFYGAKRKIDSYIQNFQNETTNKEELLKKVKDKIDNNIETKRLDINRLENSYKEINFLLLYQFLKFSLEEILKYGEIGGGDLNEKKKLIVDRIKSLGYDGIKYLNLYEVDHESDTHDYSYIVLDANQIKNCEVISFSNGKVVPLENRFNKNTNNLFENN